MGRAVCRWPNCVMEKGKAASHVEHLAESVKKPEIVYENEVSACC
jgi:hypothetical protein